MAYAEKYVTSASSGGAGTEGDPWTLAEALTNATAGDRVNIQSDSGYALGADTVSGTGTVVQLLCFRGYNSSIGDLENLGWNSDGTLNTTNFPVITLSGRLTTDNNLLLLQNLVFTGALSDMLVGTQSADYITIVECKFTNTQNNSLAACVRLDNTAVVINCDLECSGAAHGIVMDADSSARFFGCRFKGTEVDQIIVVIETGSVSGCLFEGPGIGIRNINPGVETAVVEGCTFYNLEVAIQYSNAASLGVPILINNHVTDCVDYLEFLYGGTANTAAIEINNRTRDNTNDRQGVGDGANIGEVTTDTGAEETDYTNAGSSDFTLISTAPGKATGVRQYTDIGAYQRQEAGGSGGGGKQAGSGGGQVG